MNRTSSTPLAHLPYEKLCPGSAVLDAMQADTGSLKDISRKQPLSPPTPTGVW